MIKEASQFYILHKELLNFAFSGIGLPLIGLIYSFISLIYKKYFNKHSVINIQSAIDKQKINSHLTIGDFSIINEIRETFTGDVIYTFYKDAKKCMLNTETEKVFSEKCNRFMSIDKVLSIDELEKSKDKFLKDLNNIIKFFLNSEQFQRLLGCDESFFCIKQCDISVLNNLINISNESYENLINNIKKYDYNFNWNNKGNFTVIKF